MQDPKYDFRNGRLWHREGEYFVPEDEPVMVLRGKDPDVLFAILAYMQRTALMREDKEALAHLQSSTERYLTILKWQTENPKRVRRGCHNCDKK